MGGGGESGTGIRMTTSPPFTVALPAATPWLASRTTHAPSLANDGFKLVVSAGYLREFLILPWASPMQA